MGHTSVRLFFHQCGMVLFVVAIAMGAGGASGCARRLSALPAEAESVDVTATATPQRARVGDPLRLELHIRYPVDGRIEWSEPSPVFEIRQRHEKTTIRRRLNRRETRVTYELLCFEIGRHAVFPHAFVHVAPDGTRREVAPPTTEVEIVSVLEGAVQAPRDIKPPMPWPPPWPRWAWALPVVVLAALAAAFATRRAMRRKMPRTLPPPPPEREALEALAQLRARGWIETGAVEPFYVELSRIIRAYIEARFGLRAPEQTTEEFLRDAAASNALTVDHRVLLANFLEECDRVKFAQARPEAHRMHCAWDTAERFVRETSAPVSAPEPDVRTSAEASA